MIKKNKTAEKSISRILIISAHPPIDTELTNSWINLGYKVSLISKSVKWNEQFQPINPSIRRKLPTEEPDLIVVGHPTDTIYAILLKIAKGWFGVRIVMIHWWFPKRLLAFYFVKNISVCNYGRKYLKKILGISSEVVYCPVDTNHFKRISSLEIKNRIITIGNQFKERKMMGYNHLLRILELIHSKDPSVEIGVIGNNEKGDFPDFVQIMNCNKEEMVKEINKASIVFFTTTHNLIMNSLQIAMACERKVVAFDLEPFHEVIENEVSGFLIRDFDDDLFSKTVLKQLTTVNNEIGIRARNSILERCESFKVAKEIIEYSK